MNNRVQVERSLLVSRLGYQEYLPVWQKMQSFTSDRGEQTVDELWLVEHSPVFTQGQAGKPEHLLDTGDIPVVKSDRGGQVTYHGPGQLVAYPLLNIRRLGMGVRDLVNTIETGVVKLLGEYGIESYAKPDAPGVYVGKKKISSLGLRVRKGCCFHGVAINVDMDLTPYTAINPCGYEGLEMTDIRHCLPVNSRAITCDQVGAKFAEIMSSTLGLCLQQKLE